MRSLNAETQKTCSTGNAQQEGKTLTDAETAWPDLNPTQGANKLGNAENHTIQGTLSQNQYYDQAEHVEADEEPYNMPQEQEMQSLDEEEDEYNHLYAIDPAQAENKELNQITMLKDNMEYMLQELKQARNSKHWHKLGFNEWQRKMTTLCEMGGKEAEKPAESIIANLAETNVYLTRKLLELEAKTPPGDPEQ